MSDDLSTSPEAAKSAIDRLTFFSDAVVAIAMTLLVIDLPVPDGDTRPELWTFLGDHLSEYLAFFISFAVIAQYWRGHHRVYRYVVDAPPRLVQVNTLWLLTVVLTPYATRVLYGGGGTSESDFPIRFGLYAFLVAAAGAVTIWGARVIEAGHLLAPDTPRGVLTATYGRCLALVVVFLASIPLAFVVGQWAFVTWMLLPTATPAGIRFMTGRRATAGAG